MILVTGTSGALGGLILERLTGVPGLHVTGGTRAGDGSIARRVDFDDPGTLGEAFAGVDVLVFVSAGFAEDDAVLTRHGAAIDAAAKAGIRHVIYTSLVGSGDRLTIALAHRWTETRLADAPFEITVLRNGLYAEIPAGLALAAAETAAATGVFSAPFGGGRISAVARADLADVAVRVAAEAHADLAAGRRGRHAGRTYELAGVEPIGGEDIAATLAAVLGRPVRYTTASLADTRAALTAAGLEPYQVAHSMSTFSNLSAGLLEQRDSDLPALLDTPPRSVRRLVADTIRSRQG